MKRNEYDDTNDYKRPLSHTINRTKKRSQIWKHSSTTTVYKDGKLSFGVGEKRVNLSKHEKSLIIPVLVERSLNNVEGSLVRAKAYAIENGKSLENLNISNKNSFSNSLIKKIRSEESNNTRPMKATVTVFAEEGTCATKGSKGSIHSISKMKRTFEVDMNEKKDVRVNIDCMIKGSDSDITRRLVSCNDVKNAIPDLKDRVNVVENVLNRQLTLPQVQAFDQGPVSVSVQTFLNKPSLKSKETATSDDRILDKHTFPSYNEKMKRMMSTVQTETEKEERDNVNYLQQKPPIEQSDTIEILSDGCSFKNGYSDPSEHLDLRPFLDKCRSLYHTSSSSPSCGILNNKVNEMSLDIQITDEVCLGCIRKKSMKPADSSHQKSEELIEDNSTELKANVKEFILSVTNKNELDMHDGALQAGTSDNPIKYEDPLTQVEKIEEQLLRDRPSNLPNSNEVVDPEQIAGEKNLDIQAAGNDTKDVSVQIDIVINRGVDRSISAMQFNEKEHVEKDSNAITGIESHLSREMTGNSQHEGNVALFDISKFIHIEPEDTRSFKEIKTCYLEGQAPEVTKLGMISQMTQFLQVDTEVGNHFAKTTVVLYDNMPICAINIMACKSGENIQRVQAIHTTDALYNINIYQIEKAEVKSGEDVSYETTRSTEQKSNKRPIENAVVPECVLTVNDERTNISQESPDHFSQQIEKMEIKQESVDITILTKNDELMVTNHSSLSINVSMDQTKDIDEFRVLSIEVKSQKSEQQSGKEFNNEIERMENKSMDNISMKNSQSYYESTSGKSDRNGERNVLLEITIHITRERHQAINASPLIQEPEVVKSPEVVTPPEVITSPEDIRVSENRNWIGRDDIIRKVAEIPKLGKFYTDTEYTGMRDVNESEAEWQNEQQVKTEVQASPHSISKELIKLQMFREKNAETKNPESVKKRSPSIRKSKAVAKVSPNDRGLPVAKTISDGTKTFLPEMRSTKVDGETVRNDSLPKKSSKKSLAAESLTSEVPTVDNRETGINIADLEGPELEIFKRASSEYKMEIFRTESLKNKKSSLSEKVVSLDPQEKIVNMDEYGRGKNITVNVPDIKKPVKTSLVNAMALKEKYISLEDTSFKGKSKDMNKQQTHGNELVEPKNEIKKDKESLLTQSRMPQKRGSTKHSINACDVSQIEPESETTLTSSPNRMKQSGIVNDVNERSTGIVSEIVSINIDKISSMEMGSSNKDNVNTEKLLIKENSKISEMEKKYDKIADKTMVQQFAPLNQVTKQIPIYDNGVLSEIVTITVDCVIVTDKGATNKVHVNEGRLLDAIEKSKNIHSTNDSMVLAPVQRTVMQTPSPNNNIIDFTEIKLLMKIPDISDETISELINIQIEYILGSETTSENIVESSSVEQNIDSVHDQKLSPIIEQMSTVDERGCVSTNQSVADPLSAANRVLEVSEIRSTKEPSITSTEIFSLQIDTTTKTELLNKHNINKTDQLSISVGLQTIQDKNMSPTMGNISTNYDRAEVTEQLSPTNNVVETNKVKMSKEKSVVSNRTVSDIISLQIDILSNSDNVDNLKRAEQLSIDLDIQMVNDQNPYLGTEKNASDDVKSLVPVNHSVQEPFSPENIPWQSTEFRFSKDVVINSNGTVSEIINVQIDHISNIEEPGEYGMDKVSSVDQLSVNMLIQSLKDPQISLIDEPVSDRLIPVAETAAKLSREVSIIINGAVKEFLSVQIDLILNTENRLSRSDNISRPEQLSINVDMTFAPDKTTTTAVEDTNVTSDNKMTTFDKSKLTKEISKISKATVSEILSIQVDLFTNTGERTGITRDNTSVTDQSSVNVDIQIKKEKSKSVFEESESQMKSIKSRSAVNELSTINKSVDTVSESKLNKDGVTGSRSVQIDYQSNDDQTSVSIDVKLTHDRKIDSIIELNEDLIGKSTAISSPISNKVDNESITSRSLKSTDISIVSNAGGKSENMSVQIDYISKTNDNGKGGEHISISVDLAHQNTQASQSLDGDSLTQEERDMIDEVMKRICIDIEDMLIDQSGEILLGGNKCKENISKSDSCEREEDMNPDFCNPPIINYKTHTCFDAKAPIKIARHEVFSHIQMYKSANPDSGYKLTNNSWIKSEILVPNDCKKRLAKKVCPPACPQACPQECPQECPPECPKINKCQQTDILDQVVNSVLDECLCNSADTIATTTKQQNTIPTLESCVPLISRRDTHQDTPVYIKQTAEWPPIRRHESDCIQTPYGYKKQQHCCNKKIPVICNRGFQNTLHRSIIKQDDEFIIPKDGVFGRDPDEPKLTNFCCNTCNTWISHGNRDEHMESCMAKKKQEQSSQDTNQSKSKPRTIKKMPGTVCSICGSRFTQNTLARHEAVCKIRSAQANNNLDKQSGKVESRKPEINGSNFAVSMKQRIELGNRNCTTEDASSDFYSNTSRKNWN